MALITLRQLLDHAAEHGHGVPVRQEWLYIINTYGGAVGLGAEP